MRNSKGHAIHVFLLLLAVTSFGLVGASSDQRMTGFSHRTVLPFLLPLFFVREGFTMAVTSTEIPVKVNCGDLPKNHDISHLLTCNGHGFMINAEDGVVDFSKADQTQMDIFSVKQGVQRTISSSFKLKNSIIKTFRINLILIRYDIKVEIMNNDFLENLEFWSFGNLVNKKLSVVISGNRKLTQESLTKVKEKLNTSKGVDFVYLQPVGECNAPSALVSFKNFDGCAYVKGNLVIDKSANVSYNLSSSLEIRGCVQVTGTDLDNVDFMTMLEPKECDSSSGHKITGNQKLCIHPEFEENLKTNFTGIDLASNRKCDRECTSEYLLRSKNDKCKIVTGTLKLTGNLKDEDLSYLDNVFEIRGRLVIKRTDLEIFTILNNLETIDARSFVTESAIEVSFNENLSWFSLPSLTTVESNKIQKVIYMVNNGFDLDNTEIEEWENKYGKDKVQIIKPRPTINPSATEITQTDRPTVHRIQKEETTTKTSPLLGSINVSLLLIYFIQNTH